MSEVLSLKFILKSFLLFTENICQVRVLNMTVKSFCAKAEKAHPHPRLRRNQYKRCRQRLL